MANNGAFGLAFVEGAGQRSEPHVNQAHLGGLCGVQAGVHALQELLCRCLVRAGRGCPRHIFSAQPQRHGCAAMQVLHPAQLAPCEGPSLCRLSQTIIKDRDRETNPARQNV